MRKEKWLLKTQDSYEKHLEVVSVSCKEEEEGIHYHYQTALGDCSLYFHKKEQSLRGKRKGEVNIEWICRPGKREAMKYESREFQDIFVLKGISCEGSEAHLNFAYHLYDERGEKLNEIHIEMKRRP